MDDTPGVSRRRIAVAALLVLWAIPPSTASAELRENTAALTPSAGLRPECLQRLSVAGRKTCRAVNCPGAALDFTRTRAYASRNLIFADSTKMSFQMNKPLPLIVLITSVICLLVGPTALDAAHGGRFISSSGLNESADCESDHQHLDIVEFAAVFEADGVPVFDGFFWYSAEVLTAPTSAAYQLTWSNRGPPRG